MMQDIDTTQPSRALDAAVARAMGFQIVQLPTDESHWIEGDGLYAAESDLAQEIEESRAVGYYTDHLLREYSSGENSAAIVEMILWLQEHGYVLIERIGGKAAIMSGNKKLSANSDLVAGEPLQALALALCQVVVRVGGVE